MRSMPNFEYSKLKKKKGFVQFQLTTIIELIIVLLFFFLLIKLIQGFGYPHRQTAFANVELLRSSMNKVCAQGGSTTLDGFELPQNIPPDFGGLQKIPLTDIPAGSVFPSMFINTNGDPTYVLYYESFPAAEGIGWEIYTKPPTRVIVPYTAAIGQQNQFKDLDGLKVKEAIVMLEKYQNFVSQKYSESDPANSHPLGPVVFSNIVLSNNLPEEVFGERSKELGDKLHAAADTGVWRDANSLDNSYKFYSFNAYQFLPLTNKTLIKYRSCGAGNLCLKTNEGVYAFPLDACKKKDIKYVQLVYDTHFQWSVLGNQVFGAVIGGSAVGGGIGTVKITEAAIKKININSLVSSISKFSGFTKLIQAISIAGKLAQPVGWFIIALNFKDAVTYPISLHYLKKHSDFYLASPCKYKGSVKIEKIDNCLDSSDSEYFKYDPDCTKMISYPIYESDGKTVNKIGEHYSCIDSVQNTLATSPVGTASCLRIVFSPDIKDNYCWSGSDIPIIETVKYNSNFNGVVLGNSADYKSLIDKDNELVNNLLDMQFILRWRWPTST